LTRWDVHVRSAALGVGVQLNFIPDGFIGGPTPPLTPGDPLTLILPNNNRASGIVISASATDVIQVGDVRWLIRPVAATDNPIPPPREMPSVSWIIVGQAP
jgi:hypothetical protein